MIVLWILLIVGLGVAVYVSLLKLRNKREADFVSQNSSALKMLSELNKNTVFDVLSIPEETHTYDNIHLYDQISCEDYLIYQLQFRQKQYDIKNQMKKADLNKTRYAAYLEALSRIQSFGKFDRPIGKYKEKHLLSAEKRIFNQERKNPSTHFTIRITLSCSRINGRIYKKKSQTFDSDQVRALLKRINHKNGSYYNDRGIWDALCRVERGRVSNKMRFFIYQRDGYRCCLCGRSDRFADLEIDHIQPIAKGGKCTPDNLQTLCRRCNRMKGDSY